MEKRCPGCEEYKDIKKFAVNKSKKDGRQAYCRLCKNKYDSGYYHRNEDTIKKRSTKNKQLKRKWFKKLKAELQCKQCGEDHPACLCFHHNNPSEKEIAVSMSLHMGWGKERILDEIKKCTVLCENCHRKLHWRLNND